MYFIKPNSVTVTMTPETIDEDDSLRNAKILHKNNILVYWGNTLELSSVTGSIQGNNRKEQFVGFDGLKINFTLPEKVLPKYNQQNPEEPAS